MAKIIAVVSQKGGVGKTTTVANLGAALAREGQLVLLVEIDPQGALAPSFGVGESEWSHGLEHALREEIAVERAILQTSLDGLALLPATGPRPDELALERLLSQHPHLLCDVLDRVAPRYDVILLDGSPTLGALSYSTLLAADSYLVPVQAEEFSYRTLGRMIEFADRVRDESNPDLHCEGLLITMADLRTRMSVRVINQLHENYGDRVLMSMVPRMVAMQEMPLRGAPAVIYAESSRGAQAYREVALEILLDLQHAEAGEAAAMDFADEQGEAPSFEDFHFDAPERPAQRSGALESLRNVNPELLLTSFGAHFEGFDIDNPEDEDLRIH